MRRKSNRRACVRCAQSSGRSISRAATVELAEGDGVQLPSLAGKTVREVTEICQKLGLNPVLVGTAVVQQQQPEAGAMVRRGGSVTVWFGRPAAACAGEKSARPRDESCFASGSAR